MLLASEFDRSKYLKAADFEGDRKLKIKSVTKEIVGTGEDKEVKLVVWFTNDERGLVLNKTNNRALRGAFGDDTAGWAGRVIIAYPTETDLRGRIVAAIRVRIPMPKQAVGNVQQAAAAKPKTTTAPEPDDLTDDPPTVAKAKPATKPPADNDMDDEIAF